MTRINQWEELYHSSKQFTKPASIDNLSTAEERASLERLIIKVINQFLVNGEVHKGIKVYVNQELSHDIVPKMQDIRPQEDESIETWAAKVFGEEKFGIVLNSLEDYDNELSEMMAKITAPLIQQVGIPLGGLSFLFFMGNYGLTPFGIHKEAKGEEGFLFHLGPGKKEFYAWDIEELNKIEHNTKVFHEEIAEMLPSSRKYELAAGSVMFVPHQVYHIANTDEFSLSIVMDYINPSKEKLEHELIQSLAHQHDVEDKKRSFLTPIPLDKAVNNSMLDETSIMTKFKNALAQKMHRLRSNAGILKPSIKIGKAVPNTDFSVKGKKVFPLILQEEAAHVCIYARGHEVTVKSNAALSKVLESLNEGTILTLAALRAQLTPEWEVMYVYSLIAELLTIDAIEIDQVTTA